MSETPNTTEATNHLIERVKVVEFLENLLSTHKLPCNCDEDGPCIACEIEIYLDDLEGVKTRRPVSYDF